MSRAIGEENHCIDLTVVIVSVLLQGRRRAVVLAVNIICDAVDRYKELCEGAFCGTALICCPLQSCPPLPSLKRQPLVPRY